MTFNCIYVALSYIVEDAKAKCNLPYALLDKTTWSIFFKVTDLKECKALCMRAFSFNLLVLLTPGLVALDW